MNMATKIILAYYLVLNLVLLITMGIDKMRATHKDWRVPESTLFIMSLLGGAIGGFGGMFLFHHKTKNQRFT
jgi:Predicted membrane protein